MNPITFIGPPLFAALIGYAVTSSPRIGVTIFSLLAIAAMAGGLYLCADLRASTFGPTPLMWIILAIAAGYLFWAAKYRARNLPKAWPRTILCIALITICIPIAAAETWFSIEEHRFKSQVTRSGTSSHSELRRAPYSRYILYYHRGSYDVHEQTVPGNPIIP
ncbi:MAG: hypothetical protein ACNA8P_12090 [Phycisphaerales bacterium]